MRYLGVVSATRQEDVMSKAIELLSEEDPRALCARLWEGERDKTDYHPALDDLLARAVNIGPSFTGKPKVAATIILINRNSKGSAFHSHRHYSTMFRGAANRQKGGDPRSGIHGLHPQPSSRQHSVR